MAEVNKQTKKGKAVKRGTNENAWTVEKLLNGYRRIDPLLGLLFWPSLNFFPVFKSISCINIPSDYQTFFDYFH